ncbi:MAG TPA: glycosyltransferase family 1 protein [Chitinophagales bacterium]|nr:glycosyltransferase family 1 protein [Chitinophagales bacterium]
MRIGVWVPEKYLHSVRIYYEQVSRILCQKGVEFIPFGPSDALPVDVDLYWDPTCTGGKNPNKRFLKRTQPLVATVHGASNFALPHHYTYNGWKQQLKGYYINAKRKFYWKSFRKNIEGIITVSNFAKAEIIQELQLDADKIRTIYHGYDSSYFVPIVERSNDYLFHVSVFQPVKNIPVLLKAYQKLEESKRLPLILLIPGYPHKIDIKGVTLLKKPVSQKEIAQYMQHAKAFILPSVRESFGLPIIEAMAVGTPVITSLGSACEEITKGYGILCQPNKVEDWSKAIEKISSDTILWNELHRKSLQRAQDFSWEKCAEQHYSYFYELITKK